MNAHVIPASIVAAESHRASVVADLMAGITLITTEELAASLRFTSPNDAFRRWLRNAGIKPVPGRKGMYDPQHVRARLNAIQGIDTDKPTQPEQTSLTEQRRARLAKAK